MSSRLGLQRIPRRWNTLTRGTSSMGRDMPKPKKGHPWAVRVADKIVKCVACGYLFKQTVTATSVCQECQRGVSNGL